MNHDSISCLSWTGSLVFFYNRAVVDLGINGVLDLTSGGQVSYGSVFEGESPPPFLPTPSPGQ